MKPVGNSRWSVVLNALLVSHLAAGPVFAQSIPGLGGQTQPKVMIIFDTSQSMQHLPSTDLSQIAGAPSLGGRGWNYLNDDYDPAGFGPDGGCDNRFCIAKNVLYNTLPVYSDSVEMGITGFYQYRTSYLPAGGTTQCKYDVLSGPGADVTFSRVSGTLAGSSVVPDNIAGLCSANEHKYNVTLASSVIGTTLTCPLYYNAGTSFSGTVNGTPSCDSTMTWTGPTTSSQMYFGGSGPSTSNLWVRMAKGTASCPTGSFLGYGTNSRDFTSGTATSIDTGNFKFYNGPGTAVASRAFTTAATQVGFSDLRNRCSSSSNRGLCSFTYSNAMAVAPSPGAETSIVNIGADAGTSIVSGGRTYTRTATGPTTYNMTRAPLSDGKCYWPPATSPTPPILAAGNNRVESSLSAYSGAPSAAQADCTIAGCRVTYTSQSASSTVTGSLVPVNPDRYQWAVPPGYPGTCSVAGGTPATGTIPYVLNSTVAVTENKGAAACGTTKNFSSTTGLSSSPTLSCSSTNVCEGQNGRAGTTVPDSTIYYTPLASPGTKTPVSGYPLVTQRYVPLTVSGGAEKCAGFGGGTVALASSVSGCGPSGCSNATYKSFSPTGGVGPPNQIWGSNTPASYLDTGSTFSSPVAYGGVQTANYEIPKPGGASCPAALSIASGISMNGVVCSAAHPCALEYKALICKDTSGNVITCPSTFADYTGLISCGYRIQLYSYSAPTFGNCIYDVTEHKYEQKTCAYDVRVYRPSAPSCSAPGTAGNCNFSVTSYPYSFSDPFPYCRAYATKFDYTTTTPSNYTYKYQTRGGEYLGTVTATASPKLAARNYCSLGTTAYNTSSTGFADVCPPIVDISNVGNGIVSSDLASACGVNSGTGKTVCKLSWRGVPSPASSWGIYASGRLSYRIGTPTFGLPSYETHAPTNPRCLAPDRAGGEIAVSPTAPPPTSLYTPTSQFCTGTGSTGTPEIRLRSDYYQTGTTNSIANIFPGFPTQAYADSWTNQASKESGWGRNEVSGSTDPKEQFVPPTAGTEALIKKALSRCVRPTDLTTPANGGLCMADKGNCNGASACQPIDYTPLNGSLINAKNYLSTVLATDTERLCRDYYVLLVTDGLESTPANYGQTNLRDSVDSLRSIAGGGATKDVKTFVIGFGAGLGGADSGVSDLDIIARRGGTGMLTDGSGRVKFDDVNGLALSAVNEIQLKSALNIVFSNITAGRFARSRPAVGTDGTRLYVSYFDRGSSVTDGGTPEWQGNMTAFALDPSGNLDNKWELRAKVDNATAGSRDLRAELSDGTVTNFVSSNTTLASAVKPGDPTTGAKIIDFVRNDNKGASANEKFLNGVPKSSRVGAFAFSAPLVIGPSPFPVSYGGLGSEAAASSYSAFKAANVTRETRILLGSYDGLFRGVRDQIVSPSCTGAQGENDPGCPNGKEAWGYVPYDALGKLDDTRVGPTPVIDGPSSAADVCWPASGNDAANCALTDWRTIAVGSYRSGGKSLFALDVTNPAAYPTRQWSFNDGSGTKILGNTYQPPMFGRVNVSGEKRWVAVVSGGLNGIGQEGKGVFVLNAKTGVPNQAGVTGIDGDTKFPVALSQPPTGNTLSTNQAFVARPALYKRPGSTDTETAYFPNMDGQLFASRFPTNTSSPHNDWEPRKMYDPWDQNFNENAFGEPATKVGYVNKTTGFRMETNCETQLGKAGAPNPLLPAAVMPTNCSDFQNRRPIFAQAKVAAKYDASGVLPDIFLGTGDANQLGGNTERNFFFGVHDSRFSTTPAGNVKSTIDGSGKALWMYTFDLGEKIVGNPTFSGGSIVVATYKPPVSGSTCKQFGDAYLYAFDPKTGDPRPVLLDPTSSLTAPVFKSVIELKDAGALSDLITFKGSDQIGFAQSNGGTRALRVRNLTQAGRVQGWRRSQ